MRHLPICDGKRFKGLVSHDVLLLDLNKKDAEVRMMRAHIHSGEPGM